MVIICKDKFSENDTYNNHFQEFPFELSDFQKYAIKSIVEGDHILVTAHTGSGKTLPAEFTPNKPACILEDALSVLAINSIV